MLHKLQVVALRAHLCGAENMPQIYNENLQHKNNTLYVVLKNKTV